VAQAIPAKRSNGCESHAVVGDQSMREWVRAVFGVAAVALIVVHAVVPSHFKVDTTSFGP
jgi:signal peptidase I